MKTQLLIFIVIFLLLSLSSKAQLPFVTVVKEPRFTKNVGGEVSFVTSEDEVSKAVDAIKKTDDVGGEGFLPTGKDVLKFFNNNHLGTTIINDGPTRVNLKSQVLHYKLYIANPKEGDKERIYKYNIPLLLITKLSSNYDSLYISSGIDAIDYEPAPITIRTMPSWSISDFGYNQALFWGVYFDYRGLNLLDNEGTGHEIEMVRSFGIGVTYMSEGEASSDFDLYEPGSWVFSLMLQGASGEEDVMKRMFQTSNNLVGAIQGMFMFKISKENNSLNLKVGYQYLFDKLQAGNRQIYSIALGM